MRILFFIDGLGSGGKERRLVELMKGLKSKPDFEYEIVVMNQDIHYQEVFNLGVKIHYLVRTAKKDFAVFHKFYKICYGFKPDIVHCWDSMTAVIAVPACRLLGIKLVNGMVVNTLVKRNVSNKHWIRARLTFPFSTVVIGNSNKGLTSYGAPSKKSSCIYNGIDLGRLHNLKDPALIRKEIFGDDIDDLFVAGMVATFDNRKDYKTLIEAAIVLTSRNNNLHFVLIGDGVDFSKIKNSVPDSLAAQIHFLGKRSGIEPIVNIFDVGILLTNTDLQGEGVSNAIIEYMASGKPVIATRGGGTDEVVIDGLNGYLVDAHSKDQVIEKIEALMKQKSLAISLGKNGRKMVDEKFDLRIMTSNYISLYHRLINGETRENQNNN